MNLCRTVVNLFVSTGKSSGKNRLSRRTNIRRFVRRKICSFRLHITRFVRPDDLCVMYCENGQMTCPGTDLHCKLVPVQYRERTSCFSNTRQSLSKIVVDAHTSWYHIKQVKTLKSRHVTSEFNMYLLRKIYKAAFWAFRLINVIWKFHNSKR